MFDWKGQRSKGYQFLSHMFRLENFGTLSQTNAPLGMDEPSIFDSSFELWHVVVNLHVLSLKVNYCRDQKVAEVRQSKIPKSPYHAQLEEVKPDTPYGRVRYWSDYSHVYYLPRSVQRVSRPAESGADDWKQSQDQFQKYNEARVLINNLCPSSTLNFRTMTSWTVLFACFLKRVIVSRFGNNNWVIITP
jgi:hypothetical protein